MTKHVTDLLLEAREQVDRDDPGNIYDETLLTVADRAAEARCLTKADFGSLVLWKRISAQTGWARHLGMTPDETVRRVSGAAWQLANDTTRTTANAGQAARDVLRALPGMGPAVASAVLLACAPTRMAIWDRRVGVALDALDRRPTVSASFYGAYLSTIDELAKAVSPTWLLRDADLALYAIGGNSELIAVCTQVQRPHEPLPAGRLTSVGHLRSITQ